MITRAYPAGYWIGYDPAPGRPDVLITHAHVNSRHFRGFPSKVLSDCGQASRLVSSQRPKVCRADLGGRKEGKASKLCARVRILNCIATFRSI